MDNTSALVHAQDPAAAATHNRALRAREGRVRVQRRLQVRKARLSGVLVLHEPCLFCREGEETQAHMHAGSSHWQLL